MGKSLLFFIHGIGSNKDTWNSLTNCLIDDHSITLKEHKFVEHNKTCDFFYKLDEYESPIINNTITVYNPCTWFNIRICKWGRQKDKGEIDAGELLTKGHADSLISKLNLLHSSYENIYLIGHSMGGLVILESLFKLFPSPENIVLSKIKKVVLIASPIAGSEDSDDIKKFFDNKLTEHIFSQAVKELSPESQTIISIQQGIREYSDKLKDLNCLFINGKTDSRILQESVEFAESFCEIEHFSENHTSIKDPKNVEDPKYKTFYNFIFLSPNSVYQQSINGVKSIWYTHKAKNKNHASHIVLASDYTHTIYANGSYIAHHKYKFQMMEDGIFDKFYHKIIPFDKTIKYDSQNNSIKDDDYYKNMPGNRFEEKAYKITFYPKTLPITSLDPIYSPDGSREWIQFNFTSEPISKGTKFWIEISISDKIDFTNQQRMKDYFESTINNEKNPHARRHIKYQIETYIDRIGEEVNLPFMPWATEDSDNHPWLNLNNCYESIYYKTWNWKFYFSEKNPRSIKIDLINKNSYKSSGPPCEYPDN